MLQELSLHGSVPASRHHQVLSILAGVTGSPPVPVTERHRIFRPTRDPSRREVQVGGSQNIQDAQKAARKAAAEGTSDLFFLRCVCINGHHIASSNDVELKGNSTEMDIDSKPPQKTEAWELRFYDVPEFTSRPVTIRSINVTPIEGDDPDTFMKALEYKPITEFISSSHRFVHNNIVIHLQRLAVAGSTGVEQEQALVDPSGAYVLEATVRLADASEPDVSKRGEAELINLKEALKGVLDLRVVDRLSLDTRIR